MLARNVGGARAERTLLGRFQAPSLTEILYQVNNPPLWYWINHQVGYSWVIGNGWQLIVVPDISKICERRIGKHLSRSRCPVPQVRPSVGLTWDHCTRPSSAQVSVQKKDANLGHQAPGCIDAPIVARIDLAIFPDEFTEAVIQAAHKYFCPCHSLRNVSSRDGPSESHGIVNTATPALLT